MRHRAPLKAALLCHRLALGSSSIRGWDRYCSAASQFDQALIKMCSPIPQSCHKSCGRAGDMPACPYPDLKGFVTSLFGRGCRGTGGVGAAERGDGFGPAANRVFLEWYPGCPTQPSQPRLSQCHRNLLPTAKFLNTMVLMSACTSVSFPNL